MERFIFNFRGQRKWAWLGLLLAALPLAELARAAEPTPTAEDLLEKRLAAIEAKVGGRLGVAALAIGSGQRIAYRADERFPMCSTFKMLAVAAVLHRVDQKQEQLDRFIPYSAADLLEYAPVTRKHVAEGGMKLSALCAAAISLSDNTAANLLLKTIGGPEGLTRFARTLGDQQTRLDRMEPDLNNFTVGDERDTTAPAAMLGNLRALLLKDKLSPASRNQLENWMVENKTGDNLIRAGLPKDWRVGDKTGRGGLGAIGDIATIRPPGKQPILLVVYEVGSIAPMETRAEGIASVARLVAETL
jgi:beta-lactamase class A